MRKKLHKLLFLALLFSGAVMYSQTSLPGTIEVENGDLSQNNNHYDRNIVGDGNGGTANIVDNWRKTRIRPTAADTDSGAGKAGTIINNVTVTADGNYDFTFTYFKNSTDGVITINATDANGVVSSVLSSFTLARNDATGGGTASTTSYTTQTVTGVALTTAITYITFTNDDSKNVDLDNVIVAASGAPVPPTITSAGTGNWEATATWNGNVVPTAGDNVTIGAGHVISINDGINAVCNDLITGTGSSSIDINAGGTLTVNGDITINRADNSVRMYSTKTEQPAFLLKGSFISSSGTRRMLFRKPTEESSVDDTGRIWHLLSNPFKSLAKSRSIALSSTNTFTNTTNGDGTLMSFGSYDETNDSYEYFVEANKGTGNLIEGKGYAVALNNGASTGAPAFVMNGNYNHGTTSTIPITAAGNGYNLVGNAYLAYVYANNAANSTHNVLLDNSGILDEATIWLWDGDNSAWITVNQSDAAAYHISPAQGFFVKAKTEGGTFTFDKDLQTVTSNSSVFLKNTNNRFEIDLTISNGEKITSTSIRYIDGTSQSFDNGYDSSMFGGYASDLEVYTNLLADNTGKKLAIQSLPNKNFEEMIVPVGVTATENSDITFKANVLNLPKGYNVYLEDRLEGTLTKLDGSNEEYTVTVKESSTDGRFFLHTKTSSVLNIDTEILNSISIYKTNNTNLRVTGLKQGKSNITLYNILGKKVMSTSFNSNGVQDISLPKLATGIYIVQLETEAGTLNKKITLE